MDSFPQFALLPQEIQDLIWDAALATPPQIHFLHEATPHTASPYTWDHPLVPDHQSGALSLARLDLTCRASRAAVKRRNAALEDKLTLYDSPFISSRTVNITIDLGADLLCLGSADAGPRETDLALDWGAFSHGLLRNTRRLALRYQPESWEGDVGHRRLILHQRETGCSALSRARGVRHEYPGEPGPPFCPRCVANTVMRFNKLEVFYLIVDGFWPTAAVDAAAVVAGVGVSGTPEDGPKLRGGLPPPEVFHGYSRTYFELVAPETRPELKEPMSALRSISQRVLWLTMPYDGQERTPMKFGLISWH